MAGLSLSPATWGWLMILCGCCANVLSLEFITKRDKGAGHLITFAQFSFIAAEGFIQQFNFRTWRLAPRVIPWRVYALLTALFFGASVLNNWALNFSISMPVHTVFRSSGLAGTLLTGFFFYKKRYSLHQVVSCMLVCVGICTLTLADAQVRKLAASAAASASASCCGGDIALPTALALHPPAATAAATAADAAAASAIDGSGASSSSNTSTTLLSLAGPLLASLPLSLPSLADWVSTFSSAADPRWAAGIAMLSTSLFMLAFLGFEQERTYSRYGRVWREVLFYTHALSLPFCTLLWRDIAERVAMWARPESHASLALPGFFSAAMGLADGAEVRVSMFVFLAINLLTQSFCFKGVAMLTCHTSALTLSLALTLRKCVSLLLSIAYFSNTFTRAHWAGSAAVFLGIFVYANESVVRRVWGASSSDPEKSVAVVRGDGITSKEEISNGSSNGSSSSGTSASADADVDASASPSGESSTALVAPAESPSPSPRPSLSDSPSDGLRSRSSRASAAQARAAIANASGGSSKKKKRASTAAARLS